MTTDAIRSELKAEASAARQLRFAVSLAALAFGVAYAATTWASGVETPSTISWPPAPWPRPPPICSCASGSGCPHACCV